MDKSSQDEQQSEEQQQPQGTSSSSLTVKTTSVTTSTPRTLVVTSSANNPLTIPYSIQASMAASNGQTTQLFTTTAHPQNNSTIGQHLQFMPQNAFVQQQVMGQQFVYPNHMFSGAGNFIISTPQQLGQVGQGFQLQLQQPNNAMNNSLGLQRRPTSQPQAIRPSMSLSPSVRPTQMLTQNFAGQQVLTVVQSQPQLIQSNKPTTAIINTVSSDKKSVVVTQNIQPRPAQGQTNNTTFIPRLGSQIIATPTPTSYLSPQFIQQPINPGLWASNGPVFIRPQTDQPQIQYVTGPQLQFPINVNAGNSLQVTANPGVTSIAPQTAVVPQTQTTPVMKPRTLAARPLLPASSTVNTLKTPTTEHSRPVKPKPSPVKQNTETNKTPTSISSKPTTPTVSAKTSTPTIKSLQQQEVKANKTSVAMVSSSSVVTSNEAKKTSEALPVNGHKHLPSTPTLQKTTQASIKHPTNLDTNKNTNSLLKKPIEKREVSSVQESAVFTPHNKHETPTVLRNGVKTGGAKTEGKRTVKSQEGDILIHVIEDFIIEESPKPFPVSRSVESPACKENGNSTANDVSTAVVAAPASLEDTPVVKKREVTDTCPACHKPGLKSRLKTKDGSKVCSSCAGKKSVTINTNSTSRLDLFNPVTSNLTEYEFNEPEMIRSPILANAVGPSDKKKPRLSKTPAIKQSLTPPVTAKKIIPIEPALVTPSSSMTPNGSVSKSPDPVAGLFIPKSGKDPMKWSVSCLS